MKVYVYKHYNESLPYGEEAIRVFANENDAESALKSSVEEYFGTDWDKVELYEGDILSPTYVSIDIGDGEIVYWVIEEHEVIESSEL